MKLPESIEKKPIAEYIDRENDAVIDLLKLIHERLKAIERNTFKGY